MATILAYTSPAAGHLFPLVPGLLELQARGHDVHLLSPPGHVEQVRAAGLRHVAPMEPRGEIPTNDYEGGLKGGLEYLMWHGELERAELERALAAVGPDALIIDANAYGAAVGAEASGLPWALAIPSLLPWPGRGIPPYGLGTRRARAGGRHARKARLERFVPHGEVLKRAAAVVCHGGMGIVQKTIAAGVPLVAVPFGRDQPEVARRVTEARAGVAVPLKHLGAKRLKQAVRAQTRGD